jgi:hypothetical protein
MSGFYLPPYDISAINFLSFSKHDKKENPVENKLNKHGGIAEAKIYFKSW